MDSILKDSWLYKEWAQKVENGRIEAMQQDVVALVRHRFDSLAMLAQERVVLLTTPEQIHNLLFQVAGAQNEQETRRYLLEVKGEQTH